MFLFFSQKKAEQNRKAEQAEQERKAEQALSYETRDKVIEIVAVNNKTGTEYTYRSDNEFGLDWTTVDGWLHVWQLFSDGHGLAIAALVDFSIIKVVRENEEEN
jgi:hypothetical protein